MGPPSSSPSFKKVLPNPNVSPHPNLPLQYGICPFHKSRSIGLVVCVSISLFKWCGVHGRRQNEIHSKILDLCKVLEQSAARVIDFKKQNINIKQAKLKIIFKIGIA